ncbi:outer membrane protein assembly factor BamB family protein [Streptomyces lucensis]|uniref:outer membrane protein assembly factor BamB family protein n=1 Tax=Streptomyces lucensis TaxID=67319 RepID=UPI001E2AD24F|nr:PQQ-binding-like beta-propeller repeat protein [Streptomyces lucensis]
MGVVLGLLTACGGGGSGDAGGQDGGTHRSGGGQQSKAKPYDPPLKFEYPAAQHVVSGRWTVRLDGTTAYAVSDDQVKAVDVLDGKERWTAGPKGAATRDTGYATGEMARPTLTEIDGRRAVLAAFGVTTPGSGTTPDRNSVELAALDAGSGRRLWTATVDRPESGAKGAPVLVGTDGTAHAVVELGGDGDAVTLGISLDSGKVAWTAKGFAAKFVDGGTVVGLADSNGETDGGIGVQGLKSSDGSRRWSYDAPELNGATLTWAGGGLFTAGVDPHEALEEDGVALLATSTGRPPAAYPSGKTAGLSRLTCQFDDRGTTVCESALPDGHKRVFALDRSFRQLWSIDGADGSRLLPDVTTVWHGAVYGTTDNGPVVLDARTGKDRATSPAIAPYQVNEYAGLASTPSTGIEAYRAVG